MRSGTRRVVLVMLWGIAAGIGAGCSDDPPRDEAREAGLTAADFDLYDDDAFREMDRVADPESGIVRDLVLTGEQVKGRNAWLLWTGGNEAFWDWLARNGYGAMDLLRLVDSERRGRRWAEAGLITEPGTRPPTPEETEAAHGIRYDRLADPGYGDDEAPDPAVYGYSSGIVGLRLFDNPEFTGSAVRRWDADRYYADPEYASHPDTIRPFRVGMTCAFCHVGPHPLVPPEDPEFPEWANLSNNIGAQYLRSREVFGNTLEPDNFLYHVLDSQMPGTIDTSLVASDNINNANTMNAVFGVPGRVERALRNPPEVQSAEAESYPGLFRAGSPEFDTNPRPVPRVLVDGSDSVGVWVALARVYLNIGTYHQQWIRLHNPLLGFRPQEPFRLADCEAHSTYWAATRRRVEPMAKFFLAATPPMRLKDAPEGHALGNLKGAGVPWDPAYAEGRDVFARGCIACHSSIQPGDLPELEARIDLPIDASNRAALRLNDADLARLARGDGELPPAYARWARRAVEEEIFWRRLAPPDPEAGPDAPRRWIHNYLSTDRRIPVTLVGTNAGRALATNAMHGNMWQDFSSDTYRDLPSVGTISYRNPFTGATNHFEAPRGGPGYYRVPSLISAWATAPFFHGNTLGLFNNDPSVAGRLAAYDDAMAKLLDPSARRGHHEARSAQDDEEDGGLVWRTSAESSFMFRGHQIPTLVAGGTGWSPLVRFWLPWLPALGFLILGVLLLSAREVERHHDALADRVPRLSMLLEHVRALVAVVALVLTAVAAWLVVSEWGTLVVLDALREGPVPWVRIQVGTATAFFALVAVVLIAGAIPRLPMWRGTWRAFGVASLVLAVFTTAGFGRFVSGRGGGVEVGPFPAGIPVNALANMDPEAPLDVRLDAVRALLDFVGAVHAAEPGEAPGLEEFERQVGPALIAASRNPDWVLDRGHDYVFMRDFTPAEREALTDLVKTF